MTNTQALSPTLARDEASPILLPLGARHARSHSRDTLRIERLQRAAHRARAIGHVDASLLAEALDRALYRHGRRTTPARHLSPIDTITASIRIAITAPTTITNGN
jgi:hypothetical protein